MRLAHVQRPLCVALRAQRVLWPLLLSLPAWAQDGGAGGRSWSVQPSFTSSLSLVNTSRPVGGIASGTDTVLQLQPGLRLSASSGRLRGTLTYALSGVVHSASGRGSEFANALNSSGVAEVVPQWFFVEGSATVTQQAANAYGQQSVSLDTYNTNRTEVANVVISPYLRGLLGPAVRYEARLTASGTNARRSKIGDSRGEGALLSLSSATDSLLGWGLQATQDKSHFRLGRDTQVERVLASASWRPDPELGLTARGGSERSDVLSLESRTYANWGAGARWTPTERTVISGDLDRRYFGNAYSVAMTHRMPLTSFRIASSRSALTSGGLGTQSAAITLGQLYDLLLTSRYPDPVQRALVVQQLLGARNPNELVQGGFVNQGIQLSRRDEIAWTYGLQRVSLNLIAFRNGTRTLDAATGDPRSGETRQQGYTGLVSYQLTPSAALNVNASLLQTLGTSTIPGTNLKSLTVGYTDSIGRYTAVSANARYSVFNSTTDPYREAALTASLSLRF